MSKALAEAFEAAATAKNDLPVTAGMARWERDGRPLSREAIERVAEVMIADMGGRSDATGRIRPSLIGDECLRKQMLSFNGIPKEPEEPAQLTVMEAGTWGHYRWQVRGLSAGWLTSIETKVKDARWALGGSMDGVLSDGTLFELKTTNERIYDSVMRANEPRWPHKLQLGAYMLATGIEKGSIVYENRGFPDRWREFRVELTDDIRWELMLMRRDIVKSVKTKTLPDMLPDCQLMKGPKYEGCPWRFECPKAGWTR